MSKPSGDSRTKVIPGSYYKTENLADAGNASQRKAETDKKVKQLQGMADKTETTDLHAATEVKNVIKNTEEPALTSSSNISIDESFHEKKKAKRQRYQTRKCIIIHDPYFDQFDMLKFSKWFDIDTMRYSTLLSAAADKSLASKIAEKNPEVVYIHLGQADVLNKTPRSTVVHEMQSLVQNLLTNTKVKICYSLLIPLPGLPHLKSVIEQVNKEISNSVTNLRKTNGRDRIFTQNNDTLGGSICRGIGSTGPTVYLDARGQRKLWLHLRDGLQRTLGMLSQRRKVDPNPQRNSTSHV